MKRRFMLMVMLLAMGALFNVIFAWGCAYAINPHKSAVTTGYATSNVLKLPTHVVIRYEDFGTVILSVQSMAGADIRPVANSFPTVEELLPNWADRQELNRFNIQTFDTRGWPMQSMWCSLEVPQTANGAYTTHGGIRLPSQYDVNAGWRTVPRVLPLRPRWPGFAINTLIYATVIWILLFAPFALRRKLRVHRRLCAWCAYPRGDSAVCTECGRAFE